VMWQFTETLAGLSEACEALETPIVGGNVSFYNETDGVDIFPTPIVGMLGLADPMPPLRTTGVGPDMAILVLGPAQSGNVAGTAFQKIVLGTHGGRPAPPDPQTGHRSVEAAIQIVHTVTEATLHDVSRGGLLVALAELLVGTETGAAVATPSHVEAFGEDPHRFVCLVPSAASGDVVRIAGEVGCSVEAWGVTTDSDAIQFDDGSRISLDRMREAWTGAIAGRMTGAAHG